MTSQTQSEQHRGLSEHDDLIPIRMVESLAYCPRQAWYRFVAGEDPVNEHMERGLGRHRTFEEAETSTHVPSGFQRYRHLAVAAPRLGVMGVIDELDIGADELVITEYKAARLARYVWPGTCLQLAVQHLALREHASSLEWDGPLLPESVILRAYFAESRRYRTLQWNEQLETEAREAVTRARAILDKTSPPPGNVGPRCDNCQHEPSCLPFLAPIWQEAS